MSDSQDEVKHEIDLVTDIEYLDKETITYIDHYDEYYTYEG